MPRATGYSDCSFEKIVAYEGGGLATTYARFICADCGKSLDIAMRSGRPLAPAAYAKQAVREGWSAHHLKKSKVFCAECFSRERVNDPDSELKKVVPVSNVQPLPALVSSGKTAMVPVRDVTPELRGRIRNLLDKHFDDAVGMYLDDMSDEKIAEQLGVPRITVEQLREAAYGPIQVDPILAGMRAELAQLKRELEAYRNTGTKLESAIMTLGSKIEKRVAGK